MQCYGFHPDSLEKVTNSILSLYESFRKFPRPGRKVTRWKCPQTQGVRRTQDRQHMEERWVGENVSNPEEGHSVHWEWALGRQHKRETVREAFSTLGKWLANIKEIPNGSHTWWNCHCQDTARGLMLRNTGTTENTENAENAENAEQCWQMLRVRNNEKSWEILRKMMPGGFLKEDKRVRCSRKRDAKYSPLSLLSQ